MVRSGWVGRPLVLTVMALGLAPSSRASDQETSKPDVRTRPAYIDEAIRAAWKENKLKPSPVATDEEFLRRAYLDLIGRIPNVQEGLAFLHNKDRSKRAKLVEYLLASPDYPKNFGQVWTTLLIGRKSQGRNVDRAALLAWLRQQFAENRPWNETARTLITAKGSNKENGAVNFALDHLDNGAVPLTSITTRVFLGQQIQCTQCHDHPTNDWKQADFWGINAFFKGVRARRVQKTDSTGARVDDHMELFDEPSDAYSTFEKRNAVVGIAFPTYLDGRKISQNADVDRRAKLGEFITEKSNTQFARAFVNRLWGHFLGRGLVHPVDDFRPDNEPSHPTLLEKLGDDFIASGYDVKALIRWIMTSEAYNLSSVMTRGNQKDEVWFSHMALKPMTPEQLFDSLLTATEAHLAGGGDHDKQRNAWLQQFIFTFGNDDQGEVSGFQGTIPQALMMMNGELMARATGGKGGSFLAHVLDQARSQHKVPVARFVVDRLYLAALTRSPSRTELNRAAAFLDANPDSVQVVEDLFWALLNSNEFVLVH